MESSLHRQLKQLYGESTSDCEVTVDGFRIDAVSGNRLIEVQRASLGAIRSKIATLVENHRVTLVKPIAARTLITRCDSAGGRLISQRFSPLRRTLFHVFEELVHFGSVFPHRHLQIEVVLIEQEEIRVPRSRRRFRGPDYRVADRRLLEIVSRQTFRTRTDLRALLPASLTSPFHTQHLAEAADIPRWLAQKMTYCLHRCGAIAMVGKQSRNVLYSARRSAPPARKSA